MKIEPTVAAIATAEAVKAHVVVGDCEAGGEDHGDQGEDLDGVEALRGPATLRVQITEPTTSAIAAHPSGRAAARARSRSSIGRPQLQEGRAVQQAQPEQRDPGPQTVRGQQVEEVAGELVARVDRQAAEQVAEADAEQQRDQRLPRVVPTSTFAASADPRSCRGTRSETPRAISAASTSSSAR